MVEERSPDCDRGIDGSFSTGMVPLDYEIRVSNNAVANRVVSRVASVVNAIVSLALVAVILAGVGFRIVSFPEYIAESGDEWGNTIAPFRVLYEWGDPNTFFHTSLYYYVTALAYAVWFGVLRLTNAIGAMSMTDLLVHDQSYFVLVARGVSTAAAVLTIAAVYRLAAKVWNRHAGLIAAALVATLPIHVQYSKTARVDTLFVLLFVGAIAAVVDVLIRGDRRAYDRAGVLSGLATSANYPGVLLGVWVVVAHWLRTVGSPGASIGRPLLLALGTFAATSPFVLFNPETFLSNFSFIFHLSLFEHIGWEGRDALFYLRQLNQSLPWPTILAAVASVGLMLFGNRSERLLSAVPIAYLAIFSLVSSKDVRFVLPALTLFCVVMAGLPAVLGRRLAAHRFAWMPALAGYYVLLAVSLHTMALASLAPDHEMLSPPDKPLFNWIEGHVPVGSKIVVESGVVPLLDTLGEEGRFADELGKSVVRVRPKLDQEFIGAIYIGGCNYEPDKVAKREIDFAVVSRRTMQDVERRCTALPKVCEFYEQLRKMGRVVFETPPGFEMVFVYDVRQEVRTLSQNLVMPDR